MIRAMNIEKQVKDNLRQNGKKKDAEKRSRDNELKRTKTKLKRARCKYINKC